jgi:hypothetical protein
VGKRRVADALVETIGSVAGTVADPRQGLTKLRSRALRPAGAALGLALIAAYLMRHRRGRPAYRAALDRSQRDDARKAMT